MSCIRWRKTYRKTVSLSPNALEYLAQLSWNKGIWLVATVVAGTESPSQGWAALASIPIHGGLVSGEWKIVPWHQDYSDGGLRLEIKVVQGSAQLRLVNKLLGITLTWINLTLLIFGQDDPVIQELTGVGASSEIGYYLPQDSSGEFDPSGLEARLDALEEATQSLATVIHSVVASLTAELEGERQARLALQGRVSILETHYFEPVTNGDPVAPEIVFADGDIVMTWVSV